MNWYVLRQRRHEGPFSLGELNEQFNSGRLARADYLLSDQDFEKGNLAYKKASEILTLPKVPSAKEKAEAPKEKTDELLRVVGDLDAADILGAQKRLRDDQGKNRDEHRAESSQVFVAKSSKFNWNFMRFNNVPFFGVTIILVIAVIAGSNYFLSRKHKVEEPGIEITAEAESPKKSKSLGRRPASEPRRADDDGGRIMPSDSREVNDRDREVDQATDGEATDYEEDMERIEKSSPPGALDRIKSRRGRRASEQDPSRLNEMDSDLNERDRRPGAFQNEGEEDNEENQEDDRQNRQEESNDDDEPENQEVVE